MELEDETKTKSQPPTQHLKVQKTVPSAPRNLKVQKITDSSVVMSWDEPENKGNCEIQSYVIVCRENTKKKFKKIGKVDGNVTVFEAIGLETDCLYHYRVYAENEIGISEDAASLDEVTPLSTSASVQENEAKAEAVNVLSADEDIDIAPTVSEVNKSEQVRLLYDFVIYLCNGFTC